MKCICFGSLFVLMYQARGQGIKSAPLCSAIFAPFGVNLAYRDTSLPGHLKNGHDTIDQGQHEGSSAPGGTRGA